MLTEKEKMLCGEYYNAASSELVTERELAHSLCHRYNASPGCTPEKLLMLSSAFGRVGGDCYIEPPFFCDYAYNLCLGAEGVTQSTQAMQRSRLTVCRQKKIG